MGYLKFALALGFAAGVLAFPGRALDAALRAMEIWYRSVAPALFPFAAVMPYLTSAQARAVYDKLLGAPTRRLFCLPGRCASAIVTGLFAGSPGGALAVARVAAAEGLDPGRAARLAGIACAMGPVYIVSAVGVALMGSPEEGWRLAVSQLMALFITGVAFSRAWQSAARLKPAPESAPAEGERPILAAALAMLRVCGYMIVFSVGCAIFEELARVSILPLALAADLTSALPDAVVKGAPGELMAAAIGFGGICIMAQNMSVLAPVGVTWPRMLAQKAMSAAMCALIYRLSGYVSLNGVAIPADGAFEAALMLLAAVMLPCIAGFVGRKKDLYTNS